MQRSIQAGIAARIGKYSDAVEVTDSQGMRTLYVSGTPGLDAQTGHVPEDFAAQADLAWRNLEAILADLRKAKPSSAKGIYMQAISISTTMGPGLAVDKSTLDAV